MVIFYHARLHIASGNGTLSQATKKKFQCYRENFCQTRPQEEALKIPEHGVWGAAFKNRRRRYGSDFSESGHTQYALPRWQR
jgi:hypothetical protein